jgi:uncharacterized phage protein (TIGR01671 family)
MNREIKFKAFSKKENRMIWGYPVIEDGSIVSFIEEHTGSSYGYGYWDMHVLQFTGLRDKKGVDIYEGDCVIGRIIKLNDTNTFNGTVQWGTCYWCLEYRSPKGIVLKQRLANFHEFEVIGNIHENPELLK